MFENQGIELKYETINLRGLVTEVVESLKLQLEKYKATVNVQYEGETELRGDRLHLLSVVFNLLDNALKYRSADRQPEINVTINGTEDTVQLIVRDNGIGIAPEYQEKIFEKFFRVPHGDTHNAKGYGLGLSYVAQVVRKHQGTIDVQSAAAEGTTFIINLPKQQA
jgi:two-component system phosphate regulon sensor histidine kinase PhoR